MSSILRKKPLAAAAMFAGLSLGAFSAHASDISTSPYLFGDWNGTRTRLADEGITFDLGYGSEAAHNFSGGTQHITRYTDQWKLGGKLDLDKLWGWHGATFALMITDRNGRDIGADAKIGNNQLIQEVYGRSQTWHLTELSLTQQFFDGKLVWTLGRLGVGGAFAAFSCDFQNLTFCGSQPGNIVGDYWVNWPTSQWGTVLKLNTTKETYVQLGAYQINSKYVDDHYARTKGLLPGFPSGTAGALIPIEFGWTPTAANGLVGSYKFGAWYNNAGGNDLRRDVNDQLLALTGGQPEQHSSRTGAYINFQQQVSGTDANQGAFVFLNVSQADKATSATDRQIAVGMEYKGPFNRSNDFIGLAYGLNHVNGRSLAYQQQYNPTDLTSTKGGNEGVTEVFYSWSPIASLSLRPNLQYIQHPGGTSRNDNAFVLGLKTTVAF